MTESETERLTTTEAAALLTWHLAQGDAISNQQAVELTGLATNSVRRMLYCMSRCIPITFLHDSRHQPGVWVTMATLKGMESD